MPVRNLKSAARMTAAGLMFVLWLVTFALSISPALHELLHSDSQSGTHECLITAFTHGQVLSSASTGVVLAVDPVCIIAPPPVVLAFVSQPENRLAPSRAPPAPLSPQQG
jgi:hypothetical protein